MRVPGRHLDLENDPEFRCFMCFHVRTGTLLLGVCQVVSQMAILFILMALLLQTSSWDDVRKKYKVDDALSMISLNNHHKTMSKEFSGEVIGSNGERKPFHDIGNHVYAITESPTPIELDASRDNKQTLDTDNKGGKKAFFGYCPKKAKMLMALTYTSASFFIAYLLINGVIYKRPTYLLPFFALQVLDFIVSCLNLLSHITNDMPPSNIGKVSKDFNKINKEYYYGDINEMFKSFFALALKAYFLGMVWSCYKYLVLCRHQGIIRDSSHANGNHEDGSSINYEEASLPLNPPKYEELMKNPSIANMPPPYGGVEDH
jgi:hypothetical protein